MRDIEEIEADMNRARGCACNRHDCDNKCDTCDYLNYDKHFFKLKEENYQWYRDQDRRNAAINDIETDRLEAICDAEKSGKLFLIGVDLAKGENFTSGLQKADWKIWAGWSGNHDQRIEEPSCSNCGFVTDTVYGDTDLLPKECPNCGCHMGIKEL